MKFTIKWMESHDPFNWCDDEQENVVDQWENGKQSILDSFPVIDHWESDGVLHILCAEDLEAESIEKAKEYVRENFDQDVLDCFDCYLAGKEEVVFNCDDEYFCKII